MTQTFRPPNFTGGQLNESQIGLDFRPVTFKTLWLRHAATCRISKTNSGNAAMMGLWSPMICQFGILRSTQLW